ncbi:hypothetical protein INS49_013248 [Diaporthe citri]|uniref:uncharacterized protein n=1 Tax=Diaporthe citri TaxID=83186 RepID=UPI001C7FD533|nr:uncharacterized protein INS49_013248 [Diaporthe citri]KAG6357371.1 hypothetical protein INS49_013248 [Diaporthe citri]
MTSQVYYLRTSIPAIHDITISGPFHVLEAALPNLRLRLAESSEATEVFNAVTENGRLLNQFCHAGSQRQRDAAVFTGGS